MKKAVKKLIELIEEKVKKMIKENPFGYSDGIHGIALEIENNSKFLTKDYDLAINYFTNKELDLYKSNLTAEEKKKGTLLYDTCQKVLEKTKVFRKERNKKAYKVETNILTHAPYFVGGSKTRKEKGKEEGYIQVVKDGINTLTYENKMGQMLTMADAKNLFALFSLWAEQGYGEWVTFTEYSLAKRTGTVLGGKQYQMIRTSLEKLRNTSVVMQEAFDIEKGKRVETSRFDLIIADQEAIEYRNSGEVQAKELKIQFSPYISKSFANGYYTLISLAAFNELEMEISQGLYLMLSGVSSMKDGKKYNVDERTLEIPLTELYDSFLLESKPYKNRIAIEKGCEELKGIDILQDYYLTKKGKRYENLVVTKSDWFTDLLLNKETFNRGEKLEQLTFQDI